MATQAHVDKVLRLVAEQQVATGEHVSRRFVHHRLRDFDPHLVDEALAVACRRAQPRSHGFPPNDAFQVCPAGIERCGPVGGRIAAFVEEVLRFYKMGSGEWIQRCDLFVDRGHFATCELDTVVVRGLRYRETHESRYVTARRRWLRTFEPGGHEEDRR